MDGARSIKKATAVKWSYSWGGKQLPAHLRRVGALLPLITVLIYLIVFYIYPISKMFLLSIFDPHFTLEHYIHLFTVPLYIDRLIVTLKISLIVAVSCLILGYPIAYLLINTSATIRNLVLMMVVASMWISILVRTYAWIAILGRNGLVNQALMSMGLTTSPMQFIYNFSGVLIGMIHVLLPFAILPIYSVMSGIDKDQVKAAENLGANPFKAFIRVVFPLSLPGVAGSLMLIFMMSLGFYVTPLLLGSASEIMIANLIDVQVTVALQWGFGSAIAVALLISALIIIAFYNRYLGMSRMFGVDP